jgi:hypothetical protein
MSDDAISAEMLATLDLIASAIRGELGAEIDAYPGHRDPARADPMNRAFRAVVLALIARSDPNESMLLSRVSQSLRTLAENKLRHDGFDDIRIKSLIEDEPGAPDDWLAFLILSARTQITPVLNPDED